MKKLLALLLVGIMIFSLAACGDNNTTDPDKDNPGTSQSGEKNNTTSNENWPFNDIPSWSADEELKYSEQTGICEVTGDDSTLQAWLVSLENAGFGGYFKGDYGEYLNAKYYITVTANGSGGDYDYNIDISEETHEIGFPSDVAALLPAYSGDGVLICSGDSEPSSGLYLFRIYGATKESAQEYVNALKSAGFAEDGAAEDIENGTYKKTADGKSIKYWCGDEGYWGSMYFEECNGGVGEFWVTIKSAN